MKEKKKWEGGREQEREMSRKTRANFALKDCLCGAPRASVSL